MKLRVNFEFVQRMASLLVAFFLWAAPLPHAWAQQGPDFSQPELDQMLAPIALYPDALLSQILMAATYPQEVIEAQRWSLANPSMSGAQAVQAAASKNWDPSVTSLVAFPQILGMMIAKLDWTERLGDAFLGQEMQVMDTVQDLRHRAYAAGHLRSNELMRVDSQGEYITIDQADPQYAYEPYYNVSVVYGDWWWPQYPPVYWRPWAGYRERPGWGTGFMWGMGISLGAQFFFGDFDWRQRRLNVVNVHNNYYLPHAPDTANRAPHVWQHSPDHRRNIPYRDDTVRAKFSPSNPEPQPRNNFRGRFPEARQRPMPIEPANARTYPGRQPSELSQAQAATPAPAMPYPSSRPTPDHSRTPVVPVQSTVAPAAQRPHALENLGQGPQVRNSSARGHESRQAAPAPRSEPRTHATPGKGREKDRGEK